MALIPFSPEYLRVNDALPFSVRDADGRLLLAGGSPIATQDRLLQLRKYKLYVDERESEQWRRSLLGTVDEMVRNNVLLNKIAQARPDDPRAGPALREDGLVAQWGSVRMLADRILAETQLDAAWCQRLHELAARVRPLVAFNANVALYLLTQTAQHEVEQYSRHHALLCAVVCDLVGQTLKLSADEVRKLVLAALSMNISMTALQDALALQVEPLSAAQRTVIDGHAEASVRALRQAGVDDAVWLETVRQHHVEPGARQALLELEPAQRLARILRRVDIFTAKLSRRRARVGMTPTQAARDACLGADGTPDEVGSAVLRALGLYPPGTYVRLVSGETGVVLLRGPRANQPLVGCIANASGAPLGDPLLRDTKDPRHAVELALRSDAVRVRLHHERMVSLSTRRRV